MRYVRCQEIGFIISPEGMAHQPTHAMIGGLMVHPISAGFVHFRQGYPVCSGKSESLCLGGLPDDAEAMARQLRMPMPEKVSA